MTTRLRIGCWARFWLQRGLRLALILMTFATRAQSPSAALTSAASSSEPSAPPDASLGAALQSLAARASVAFSGEVTSVRPDGGVVEVQFRVDRVLLGAPGGTYTLREWSGLWAAGRRRFFAGEQATVFLHAAARGGLASPVDGMDGVLPTIPTGVGGELLVDVRRLETRVQRPMGAPLNSEGGGAIRLSDLASTVAPGTRPGSHDPLRVALPVGYEASASAPGPAQMVRLPGSGPTPVGMERSRASSADANGSSGSSGSGGSMAEPFAVQLRVGAKP